MVETLTINGTAYPLAELEALVGTDALEPPYDTAELQTLIDEANRESSNALEELLVATLLLALIPNFTPRGLAYSARDGRYYQGRSPLTTTDLQRRVLIEQAQNQARMQRLTDRMVAGDVSLEQWQRAMGRDIVRSHFRMAQSGAGTAGQLTPDHLERLRRQIVADLDGLANLAQGIADGEISEKMARYRAGRYGYSAGASFFDAQHQSHLDGRWMARRMLDPAADHCPDCPGLARPDWIPAAEVTPVGVACRCRGRCRCRVEYRMALSDRLPVPPQSSASPRTAATPQPAPTTRSPSTTSAPQPRINYGATAASKRLNQEQFQQWISAWDKTPRAFSQAIERLPIARRIAPTANQSAYQLAGAIHMGSFTPGRGRADSVWRHEYGHHIDRALRKDKSTEGYRSADPDSIEAMKKDEAALLKRRELADKAIRRDVLRDVKAAYSNGRYNAGGLMDAGFSTAKSEGFASMNNPPSPSKMMKGLDDFDVLLMREQAVRDSVDRATRRGQWNSFLAENPLSPLAESLARRLEDASPDGLTTAQKTIVVMLSQYNRPGTLISAAEEAMAFGYGGEKTLAAADLSGSITRNAIGFGHSNDYYIDEGWQAVEAWANTFSLLSSGDPLESAIAKAIAPNYSRFVTSAIREAPNGQ